MDPISALVLAFGMIAVALILKGKPTMTIENTAYQPIADEADAIVPMVTALVAERDTLKAAAAAQIAKDAATIADLTAKLDAIKAAFNSPAVTPEPTPATDPATGQPVA